jgi:uracil-DNA glycosylase
MNKTEEMRKVRDDVVALNGELADYRRQEGNHAVLGEGDHDASIMFVGEAPGKNEAKTGKPFCGASGKLLDTLLESIDILRRDVYITNIVKDRPPNNRDPLPNEIELYAPFLDRQIEIIQPKVIATLGRFAMGYIMKKFNLSFEIEPISTAHRKVYDAEAGLGKFKIAPMYHPAAAIYNQSLKEILKEDFKVLKKI